MPQCLLGNIKIHIEIPIFLLFFAFMFESPITTNLIIYRTCYITLGFNKSQCALLGTNYTDNSTVELENKVQPHATIILMSRSIIEAIIPPALCFFVGPWSDKYGRKPVMLFTLGGYILSYMIMITVSTLPNLSPWFFLLSLVPICLSGGFPSLFTVILSYITDVTSEEYRGVRMGAFEAALTIGVVAGTLSSSFVLNAYGYVIIYIICTLCIFLAWLFTLFLIPESVPNFESTGKLRNLFTFSLVKETLQTTFKRRENYDRALILTVISLMVIFVLTSFADAGVIFLYLREKFHWSLETFTFYTSINNVTWIVGSIIGAYIMNKLLHIRETIVILLGLLCCLIAAVFLGVATKTWHVYTAGSTKCLGGAIGPMARSLLSKLVPAEESGKVFSVVTAWETVGAVIGSPIYTYIYNSTYLTVPGAFNFLTAGIYLFQIILIGAIFIMQKFGRQGEYSNLRNEALINDEIVNT